jgi:hypothetical protein
VEPYQGAEHPNHSERAAVARDNGALLSDNAQVPLPLRPLWMLATFCLLIGACSDRASTGAGSATGGAGGATSSGGAAGAGGAGGAGAAAGSAGSAGVGAGGGAGTAGGAGSAGDAGAAGGGGSGGGGTCNYLSQLGLQVTAVVTATLPPQVQGGTIIDGFYELIGVKLYGGATGTQFWRTLRFVGNEMKSVERDGDAIADVSTTGTFTVSGTALTRTDNCPGPATYTYGFTATSSSFIAHEHQGGSKIAELVYQLH